MTPLQGDIKAALGGDKAALDTKPRKEKDKSPVEVVRGLSAKQRSALRARAEEIIAAIDEVEAESEPDEEEEL